MIGEGRSNHSGVIPTIGHPKDLLNPEIYGPRVIFVGKAIQWLQCTPWVNPCDISPIRHPQVGQLCFIKYCELRADLDELINLLFGCHLICDCKYDENLCHAHHLKCLCTQLIEASVLDYK